MSDIRIFPDTDQLANAAAEKFIQSANEAVSLRGQFSVVLSGGTTPHQLYQLLATDPFIQQVEWGKVHFFWGDERCVPPDHPDSNYGKAYQSLLRHLPVPQEHLHRIPAELPPEQAAQEYEETLLRFFSSLESEEERTNACFDLVLLGLGDDAHTASLFPGTQAIHENTRWTAAHYVDKLAAWRITLTPAILNRAANIIFMVSGAGKKWALEKVVYGSYQPDNYPAQVIRPIDGRLIWMADEAAAALL